METEEIISQEKKQPFRFFDSQKKSHIVNEGRYEAYVVDDRKNERIDSRNAENLFGNFSRKKNNSIREKKFRLRIFEVFIEHVCMSHGVPLKDFISDIEKVIIIRVLSQFDGNQRRAAKFLGINPTTLHEKIKKYNIYFQKSVY